MDLENPANHGGKSVGRSISKPLPLKTFEIHRNNKTTKRKILGNKNSYSVKNPSGKHSRKRKENAKNPTNRITYSNQLRRQLGPVVRRAQEAEMSKLENVLQKNKYKQI